MTPETGYVLDNRHADAQVRFDALATVHNPSTFRHITSLGIKEGWACWEIGAGTPSVPVWLAERVGPTGRVLATDIDVSRLTSNDPLSSDEPLPYELQQHDITTDPIPTGEFDLIHIRFVLMYAAQRTELIRSVARALRPGGRLLIEDTDFMLQPLACPEDLGPEQQLANELRRSVHTLLARSGIDLRFGRALPRLLRESGLTDVQAEGRLDLVSPAGGTLERESVVQLRDRLVAGGHATDDMIDRHLANLAARGFDLVIPATISAWGTRV
jgi:ubiquinone/menaquinone biosynthesis C-methylase UbiE